MYQARDGPNLSSSSQDSMGLRPNPTAEKAPETKNPGPNPGDRRLLPSLVTKGAPPRQAEEVKGLHLGRPTSLDYSHHIARYVPRGISGVPMQIRFKATVLDKALWAAETVRSHFSTSVLAPFRVLAHACMRPPDRSADSPDLRVPFLVCPRALTRPGSMGRCLPSASIRSRLGLRTWRWSPTQSSWRPA